MSALVVEPAVASLHRDGVGRLLTTFEPSPCFLGLVDERSPLVLCRAANRVGKTRHGAYIVAKRAVETPNGKFRLAGPSNTQVRTVIGAYLYEFLEPHLAPGNRYSPDMGWSRNPILLSNGSTIELRSYQPPHDVHAGGEFDLVVLDETPPPGVLEENKGRSGPGRAGQLMVLLTAVGRPATFLQEEVEGVGAVSPDEGRHIHETGWVQYVVPLTRGNVPWATDAWYEEQRAKYTGSWQEAQRIYAAWKGVVTNRRLTGFVEACIFDDATDRNMRERVGFERLRIGMDHGTGLGKQVIYLAGINFTWMRNEAGVNAQRADYWVLRERVCGPDSTPDECAQAIKEMLEETGYTPSDVDAAFGDIGMGGRHQTGDQGGGRWNLMVMESLAQVYGEWDSPITIQQPRKKRGAGPAGEAAINYACLEGRFHIYHHAGRFIDAAQMYTGVEEDLKDPIDGVRYALLDILLDSNFGPDVTVYLTG